MTDKNGEIQSLSELRLRYGDSVELLSDEGEALTFRIAAEMALSGNRYAVLQTKDMEREGEIEVFRIIAGPGGEDELESVADDDEWELVAEAFDDMQFGSDEQP